MEINHSIDVSSSSKFSKSNNIIPDEIVIEILSWLPVKSLLRFRSVCKAWLSEIANPSFTQLHLNRSPSCLFIQNNSGHYKLPLSHLLDPFEENAVKLEPHPRLPLCYVISSVNGIVCLGGHAGDIKNGDGPVPTYFWNPATKQCKALQPPWYRYVYASLGFGFDSVSSDYKVLRMGWKGTTPVVEVYSSNADSWRKITKIGVRLRCEEDAQYCGIYPCCRAIVKGVQYWDDFAEPKCTVTFDMHNEVFGQISNFPIMCEYYEREIVEFRDSVAVVVYHYNSIEEELDKRGFSLWTMDNDDFGSWTKKFSFETFPGRPLWFLKTGEILASEYSETGRDLLLYDPQTKESKIVDKSQWFDMEIDYTESLVSFKGSKQ